MKGKIPLRDTKEPRENAQNSTTAKTGTPPSQQHYISNFRSSLTVLVILHHTAIAYGGDGTVPYRSSLHAPASSPALVGFNHLNQTFFMGSFFYLAGHLSRRALQRKSPRDFVRDRMWRLGVPSAVFTLAGPPLCTAILRLADERRFSWGVVTEHLAELRGVRGPVWFLATLMTFDLALMMTPKLRRVLDRQADATTATRVGDSSLLLGLATYAAIEFIVRLEYPVGTMFRPLSLNVGYAPQYLACYLYGAYVNDVAFCLPSPTAAACLLGASVTSGVFLVKAFISDPSVLTQIRGGPNAAAACYALNCTTTGYLLGSGFLAAFSRWATRPWRLVNTLAYPAFQVHYPVFVAFGAFTDKWMASAVLKTVVVGSASVAGSWVVGGLLNEVWSRMVKYRNEVLRAK